MMSGVVPPSTQFYCCQFMLVQYVRKVFGIWVYLLLGGMDGKEGRIFSFHTGEYIYSGINSKCCPKSSTLQLVGLATVVLVIW